MGQEKLASYFEHTQLEYNKIVADLQKRFEKSIHEEIIAFVQLKTNEAMNEVWQKLHKRYEEVSKLDEALPKNPTKEDQNNYLKNFFKLTDPNKVSGDLKSALRFNNLQSDYYDFIKKMQTNEHGEIFKRYAYPSHFFNNLRQATLHDINRITGTLQSYTEAIGKYVIVVDNARKSQKDKALIKTGASLLGMLIGIPFAGAGVGALMGNDKEKINNSLKQVFNKWNLYIDSFNQYLSSLEQNYQLALMTLYGGTLLRVNDQFNVYHLTFYEMALLSCNYSLTLTEKERKDTQKWVNETISGIEKLIGLKRWNEAIKVAKELFQIVRQRPITARTELSNGMSTLYISHLYLYLAFQEALLEEYKNGHVDSFFEMTKKLYSDLPLFIKDNDIDQHFSKQTHLLFRFVKEALNRGKIKDLLVIIQYLERNFVRIEKKGYFLGELPNDPSNAKEVAEAFIAYEVITQFLQKRINYQSIFFQKETNLPLNRKQLKELIRIDAEIGSSDQFTKFLKRKHLKALFLPWNRGSFSKILQHWKKLLMVILGCLLIFGGIMYGDNLFHVAKERLSNLSWFSNKELTTSPNDSDITYLKITTEFANVRTNADLNSDIVTTVTQSDKLQFLNQKTTDVDGRLWYYVQVPKGQTGWISSMITKQFNE